MPRFSVHPIGDARCDSLNRNVTLAEADTMEEARDAAAHGPEPFGRGILDRQTGRVDVGFGFGVACPDFCE